MATKAELEARVVALEAQLKLLQVQLAQRPYLAPLRPIYPMYPYPYYGGTGWWNTSTSTQTNAPGTVTSINMAKSA